MDARFGLRGVPVFLLRGSEGHGEQEAIRPPPLPRSMELSSVRLFLHRGSKVRG